VKGCGSTGVVNPSGAFNCTLGVNAVSCVYTFLEIVWPCFELL
jgi:hypothetical protein